MYKADSVDPKKYNITCASIDDIKTTDNRSSLDMVFSVINNEDSDAKEISLFNAALSVMLYKEISLDKAIKQCRDALDEYKVRDKFNQYIDFTNQV